MSSPDQSDMGFADMSFRDWLREERRQDEARHALIVRRRAELMIKLIDQRIERAGFVRLPGMLRFLLHPIAYLKDQFSRTREPTFQEAKERDLGEGEILDVDLRQAQLIFELSDTVFVDHPELPPRAVSKFSSSRVGSKRHRLSGAAK
jgi:hypothetical protein